MPKTIVLGTQNPNIALAQFIGEIVLNSFNVPTIATQSAPVAKRTYKRTKKYKKRAKHISKGTEPTKRRPYKRRKPKNGTPVTEAGTNAQGKQLVGAGSPPTAGAVPSQK